MIIARQDSATVRLNWSDAPAASNHYYLIEGIPDSGSPLSSRRLGEFDFALTPGAP